MDKRQRLLTSERRPDLVEEDALDLGWLRKRHEESLCKAEPPHAFVVDQLKRGDVHLITANLAIADDAVAWELKARKLERLDAHYCLLTGECC
jgi:hypothetical protein